MNYNKNQKGIPSATIFLFLSFLTFFTLGAGSAIAQASKWVAPKEADELKNPLADDPGALKEGKALYTTYCTPCHGGKGRGDGVAAASLSVKPADHSSDYVQKQSDGALFWMISEGKNPMPTYKKALSENQRWELVDYIRTLAKNSKKN